MPLAGASVYQQSRRGALRVALAGRHSAPAARILALLDHATPLLLGAAIGCECAIIILTSRWEVHALRYGYDPIVYEQPIWNTLHRHVMELSTLSLALGRDLLLFNFVLLPFYAPHPVTIPLLLPRAIAAGAGGACHRSTSACDHSPWYTSRRHGSGQCGA